MPIPSGGVVVLVIVDALRRSNILLNETSSFAGLEIAIPTVAVLKTPALELFNVDTVFPLIVAPPSATPVTKIPFTEAAPVAPAAEPAHCRFVIVLLLIVIGEVPP